MSGIHSQETSMTYDLYFICPFRRNDEILSNNPMPRICGILPVFVLLESHKKHEMYIMYPLPGI